MSGTHNSNEKVVYVGDSRVKKGNMPNIPRDYSAYPGRSEAFIPNFLLKEWMVGVVVLFGILVLVMSEPAPLGYPADPTNTAFIPMPDWYFLFLYQLLKYPYTSDQFVVIGTMAMPGLAFMGLMLAPFLDRSPERRFYRRPATSALMLLTLFAMIYLTRVSWDHYQHELQVNGIVPEHIQREQELEKQRESGESGKPQKPVATAIVAEDDPAYQIYQKASCVGCHATDLKGNKTAGFPPLLGVGDTYSKDEIMDIIKNGVGAMPPQYDYNIGQGITDEEMEALADWLAKQKAEPEAAE
jgi:menaquinol-cytochrome c reductase cytochrome b/c subunit